MTAVMVDPKTYKITPDDLLAMPDQGKGYELVGGELRELNVSFLSSFSAGEVFLQLAMYVKTNRLGWVSPEGTSFCCFPDNPKQVRRADTAFHALHRLTEAKARSEGHCTVVPDLVVEVISPNDLSYEVEEKRNEWLEAGAKLVWVIHPVAQTILAYHADGQVRLFKSSDALTGEPVLPEFRVLVADLFRLPTAAVTL